MLHHRERASWCFRVFQATLINRLDNAWIYGVGLYHVAKEILENLLCERSFLCYDIKL